LSLTASDGGGVRAEGEGSEGEGSEGVGACQPWCVEVRRTNNRESKRRGITEAQSCVLILGVGSESCEAIWLDCRWPESLRLDDLWLEYLQVRIIAG
jgi:hypothetical protein